MSSGRVSRRVARLLTNLQTLKDGLLDMRTKGREIELHVFRQLLTELQDELLDHGRLDEDSATLQLHSLNLFVISLPRGKRRRKRGEYHG